MTRTASTFARFPTAATLAFEALGFESNLAWKSGESAISPVYARSAAGEVEQPAGAFLMVRRSAWQELGGFDEGFFPIWFEDVDFCQAAKGCGLIRFVYIPDATAQTSGRPLCVKVALERRQLFWYGSLLRYASKHLSIASRRCCWISCDTGLLPAHDWRDAAVRSLRVGIGL